MISVQLVEDNAALRRQLTAELEALGFDVSAQEDGAQAIAALLRRQPDVVLLDLGLPDIDGSTFLSVVRATARAVPVIVVSARADNADKVRLLDLGADDYVTKPFEMSELHARIRAVLRRSGGAGRDGTVPRSVSVGELTIEPGARRVVFGGTVLPLRPLEFELLLMLALADGQVVSTDAIVRSLWGGPAPERAARLDVHLSTLRSHLGETAKQPRYLHRVRGAGVRLAAPDA